MLLDDHHTPGHQALAAELKSNFTLSGFAILHDVRQLPNPTVAGVAATLNDGQHLGVPLTDDSATWLALLDAALEKTQRSLEGAMGRGQHAAIYSHFGVDPNEETA